MQCVSQLQLDTDVEKCWENCCDLKTMKVDYVFRRRIIRGVWKMHSFGAYASRSQLSPLISKNLGAYYKLPPIDSDGTRSHTICGCVLITSTHARVVIRAMRHISIKWLSQLHCRVWKWDVNSDGAPSYIQTHSDRVLTQEHRILWLTHTVWDEDTYEVSELALNLNNMAKQK